MGSLPFFEEKKGGVDGDMIAEVRGKELGGEERWKRNCDWAEKIN